jgi:molybdenum cofactor synthesis domain-containing protein
VSTGCAAGQREDRSGKLAAEGLAGLGLQVAGHALVPDDRMKIAQLVVRHSDFEPVSLLFLTGGTGPTHEDLTPQAISALLHRRFEGIEAAIHADGRRKLETAPLSRVIVGARNRTIIIAAPGSPGGVQDIIATIAPFLPHLLALTRGDNHPH